MAYTTKTNGAKYSNEFEVHVYKDEKQISPWHDIPLFDGEYVHCVNEIPRFENAKFEIAKNISFNPIVQDTKKGKMRFVHNIFPLKGYPFNYGAIPQTWENPCTRDIRCDAVGDNDPLDVIEIGSKRKEIGEVYKAKVIGAFSLIDEGESDWKIIVIDAKDEMAEKINTSEDIETYMPGLIKNAFFWFKNYKVADKKPVNKFGMNEQIISSLEAIEIIRETHADWQKLMKEGYENIVLDNSTLETSLLFKTAEKKEYEEKPEEPCPDYINEYFYI